MKRSRWRFRPRGRTARPGAPDRAGGAEYEYAGVRGDFAGRATAPAARWRQDANLRVVQQRDTLTLLAELLDVLSRGKFAARLAQAGLTPQGIVGDRRRLAWMVTPQDVPRVVENDADDDHVLACAVAGQADLIVSGDRHLHSLGGQHQGIPIVTPAQAVAQIGV